jgi:hypothetical protein
MIRNKKKYIKPVVTTLFGTGWVHEGFLCSPGTGPNPGTCGEGSSADACSNGLTVFTSCIPGSSAGNCALGASAF